MKEGVIKEKDFFDSRRIIDEGQKVEVETESIEREGRVR